MFCSCAVKCAGAAELGGEEDGRCHRVALPVFGDHISTSLLGLPPRSTINGLPSELSGSNDRNVLTQNPRAWKSKMEVLADWVPQAPPRLGDVTLSLCLFTSSSLYVYLCLNFLLFF